MTDSEFNIFTCTNCQKQLRYPKGKHIHFKCPNCGTQYEAIPDGDCQTIVKTIQPLSAADEKKKSLEEDMHDNKTESDDQDGGDITVWTLLGFLIVLPLFLLLNRILPNLDWVFNMDRILLFIGIFVIIALILHLIEKYASTIASTIVIICAVALTIGSIRGEGHFGWGDVKDEYRAILYSCKNGPVEVKYTVNDWKKHNLIYRDSLINDTNEFQQTVYKRKIIAAADYKNQEVIQFAKTHANDNQLFNKVKREFYSYRKEIQSFALCKYVNENWNYTNDPSGYDYPAKASESVVHLAGDCDDHAIFLASCIQAIGGKTRIVHSQKHAYPEMKISESSLTNINYIIREMLFKNEINEDQKLFYHRDGDDIWLNLDYTGIYPGAPFLKSDTIIFSVEL